MTAVVTELPSMPDVVSAVAAFADWPGLVLFDSAARDAHLGRYSFLSADPFERFQQQEPRYGRDPFTALQQAWRQYETNSIPELPPFQGGAAGLLGYELGRCWERVPPARIDEFHLPVLSVGLYDWVLAWDHVAQRAWLISQGFPETEEVRRSQRAEQRRDQILQRLAAGPARVDWSARFPQRLALADLSPQSAAPNRDALWSNFSRTEYLRAAQRVIDNIYAGDIFQANLTQRLLTPAAGSPVELYGRLRQRNPAPFAGLLMQDDWAVISASPERFLQLTERSITTRPIKGTRRRSAQPEADLFTKDALRESEKDMAENVMIVDLLRNDLSRVCQPGSIRVPQLCAVETYATVQHLVSEIGGELEPHISPWDAFRATWPGGSITGAPKVRAMEIIAELEPTARGPYTGSLFYVGFDGRVDSNLLIRTFVMRHGWWQCGVGGGIVAASDPEAEYEETWHKAAGMLRAIG